jgi:hypothetical protein
MPKFGRDFLHHPLYNIYPLTDDGESRVVDASIYNNKYNIIKAYDYFIYCTSLSTHATYVPHYADIGFEILVYNKYWVNTYSYMRVQYYANKLALWSECVFIKTSRVEESAIMTTYLFDFLPSKMIIVYNRLSYLIS